MSRSAQGKVGLSVIVATVALALACSGGGGGGGGPAAPPGPPGPPGPPPPTAVTVTTGQDLPPRFIPPDVTVAVGGIVTWQSGSPVAHNVTSNTNAWLAGTLNPNGTFQVTFTQAGIFAYTCTIHSGMNGTVRVQ